MVIYAKIKLTIEEFLDRYSLQYTGPNPEKVYPKIIEILKTRLGISDQNLKEKEYSYDRSKVPETFKGSIDAIKELDKNTYIFYSISAEGEFKPSERFGSEGKVNISFEGRIRFEYPQDTFWQRSIIYEIFRIILHKLIYRTFKRKAYLEIFNEDYYKFQTDIKNFFNILQK